MKWKKLLMRGDLKCCRPPRGGRGLKSVACWQTTLARCRPPRGGRGLKYVKHIEGHDLEIVAPLAGGVD